MEHDGLVSLALTEQHRPHVLVYIAALYDGLITGTPTRTLVYAARAIDKLPIVDHRSSESYVDERLKKLHAGDQSAWAYVLAAALAAGDRDLAIALRDLNASPWPNRSLVLVRFGFGFQQDPVATFPAYPDLAADMCDIVIGQRLLDDQGDRYLIVGDQEPIVVWLESAQVGVHAPRYSTTAPAAPQP